MDIIGNSAREDRAITNAAEDRLDRGPFVENLVRALVQDIRDNEDKLIGRKSTGFVVGLTGIWGLGKSSVLKLLSLHLSSMSNVIVITFNPWLFRGRDELISAYFNLLRAAVTNSDAKNAAELKRSLESYWSAIDYGGKAISAYADAHGGGGIVGGTWGLGSRALRAKIFGRKSADEERENLEKLIRASNCAVVILIDELDRVEDEEVRAVAQLVKAVGEIKGVSYLVAYDPSRVADALGRGAAESERRMSGEAYLEKIIQYAIPLRPLFPRDVNAMLYGTMNEHGLELPEPSDRQEKLLEAIKQSIRTPRDIKRLLGAFATLEAMLRGEIGVYDILAYSWLVTKSPTLRDLIAGNAEQLVDDPGEEEMSNRVINRMERSDKSKTAITLADVLGEQARPHERVLKFIFPRFDDDRPLRDTSEMPEAHNRLSSHRNLMRALYLGNPPHMLSRLDLEDIWHLPDLDQMTNALQHMAGHQKLRELVSRVDELYVELPLAGDAIFWPALASVILRQDDWLRHMDVNRWVVEDAVALLLRWGLVPATQERVKATLAALMSAKDYVIVPAVLRKNLFALNMTKYSRESGDREAIYTKEELSRLVKMELPNYRTAVTEALLLRRAPNAEALFVISNLSSWDDELKSALTDQLSGSLDALSSFAALVVPPGYSIDLATLAELFDVKLVLEKTAEHLAQGQTVEDEWVLACQRRLIAVMRGRDPLFDDEDDPR